MATKAYILAETEVGKTREAARTLRELEGIQSVDVVTGPYDIIAVIQGDDIAVVGRVVTEKIHTVAGVVRRPGARTIGLSKRPMARAAKASVRFAVRSGNFRTQSRQRVG